jgi:putative ABC transport system permease protein
LAGSAYWVVVGIILANPGSMIRNYFLIAFRNLYRQLSYSIINISGLAIGMACSLVMFVYVYSEWSYDRHFRNADRIYKIGVSFFNMGNFAVGPEVLGDVLPEEFAGVEAFTRIKQFGDVPIQVEETVFSERLFYTDSSFFKVFSYEFIDGDAAGALSRPASVVMTRAMAHKYFGESDAMGKTVLIGKEKLPFTVTGIVKDDPRSSQLKSSIWASIESQRKYDKVWSSAGYYSYALLKANTTEEDLLQALDRIVETKVFPASKSQSPRTLEEYKNDPYSVKFHVLALTDVHLKSKLMFEVSPTGNETNIYAFTGLSVFILILASVNFVNLTTARASRRAKEVGIRKAVGSSRVTLIAQFTLESILVSMTALVVALGLAELFIGLFESVTGDRLVNTLWTNAFGIAGVMLFALIVGMISGIYPAFYLTSFKPVRVLKGNFTTGDAGYSRSALVVFQFAISITLMISSAIIYRQMNFMQTKDLGFNQDNAITIDRASALKENAEVYRQKLLQLPGVRSTSFHAGEPGSRTIITINMFQTSEMAQPLSVHTFTGDSEFLDFMGFRLVKGRNFNKDLASDSSSIILNESAVKALGLEDPIGADLNKGNNPQYVIGVVSDFHWESLRNSIAPAAIAQGKPYQLGVRIESSRAAEFLKTAEAEWKKIVPNEPFKYHFLDENFGALLEKEKVFGSAMGFFTVLAILISCLGLYGLSAFTAEQRTKEIGIRKVLGAKVSDIVGLLNRKFLLLVLFAVVIAVPVASFLMNAWMDGFAYKTGLQWWIFLASIAGGIMVAFLTVSFHSLKAALINPAETLKYE